MVRAAISTATVSPARLVISVSSRSSSSPSRRSITSASPMNDEIIRWLASSGAMPISRHRLVLTATACMPLQTATPSSSTSSSELSRRASFASRRVRRSSAFTLSESATMSRKASAAPAAISASDAA